MTGVVRLAERALSGHTRGEYHEGWCRFGVEHLVFDLCHSLIYTVHGGRRADEINQHSLSASAAKQSGWASNGSVLGWMRTR